ncbi:MAG: ATP-binding cassette domain-containing protein [Acidimicrobiia bacterium]|nr:ATP-binding cassette domain-containing protein [Acidimicrobiia bacterium]
MSERLVTMEAEPVQSGFIEIDDLEYYYPGSEVPAVEGVNLTIEKGAFACVVGPSGCGKSTLLTILSGLSTPQTGSVSIDGKSIYEDGRRTQHEMPRCAYLFQDSRLLPWRTVRQNLDIALRASDIPREQWDDTVTDLLRMLRIEAFADSWPLNLSGGQRHRVAIARALAIDPAFILMDEPFSTLDEVTARFLRQELLEVWRRTGSTILFVTHSIREAVYLADTVALMTKGPGRVLGIRDIDVERPRKYEDPKLAEIEGSIVDTVLDAWGYFDRDEVPPDMEEG